MRVGGSDPDVEVAGRPTALGPVAHLGLAEGEVFLQPMPGEDTAVFCNGGPVTTSQWLRDGDFLRVADSELIFTSSSTGTTLEVRDRATDGTEPPSIVTPLAPPTSEGEPGGRRTIEPVDFTPAPLETGRRRRRAPSLRVIAVWLGLGLLAWGAWYLFSARPVEILVEPEPQTLELEGGLIRLQIAGRFLLRPGLYTVVAESPGYKQLVSPIEVTRASTQVFEFELEELPGLLVVSLEVETEARIRIDGREESAWSRDPIELTAGEHGLEVEAEGYRTYSTTVTVAGRGEIQTLDVELQPLWATVTMNSQPEGATVKIDGKAVGQTPVTTQVLEGERSVEISLAGFKPQRRTLQIEAEETLELPSVQLQPEDGFLVLSSQPEGATVSVDGEYRGKTPLEITVAPGRSYEVDLAKSGYESHSMELVVDSGQTRRETVDLVERMGEIEIIASPADAEIWVNGEPRGAASQTLRLQAVPQEIEITKSGYISHRQTVTPRPGVSQTLEVDLKSEQEAKAAATPLVTESPEGQQLRLIGPGRFRMGASRREPGRRANETLREVELTRAFYLSTREVSNREFRKFDGKHRSGRAGRLSLENDHHPVVNVSWEDAARYCNWLSEKASLEPAYEFRDGRLRGVRPLSRGYRLPTEAEWAWAARFAGGRDLKYPWGESLPVAPESGNYADLAAQGHLEAILTDYRDGFASTSPADSFEPDAMGLQNMGGNVAEWTHDIYVVAAGNSGAAIQDPLGPEEGDYHVIRGSSWMHSTVTELRLSFRDYGNKPRPDVGFRIARFAD